QDCVRSLHQPGNGALAPAAPVLEDGRSRSPRSRRIRPPTWLRLAGPRNLDGNGNASPPIRLAPALPPSKVVLEPRAESPWYFNASLIDSVAARSPAHHRAPSSPGAAAFLTEPASPRPAPSRHIVALGPLVLPRVCSRKALEKTTLAFLSRELTIF